MAMQSLSCSRWLAASMTAGSNESYLRGAPRAVALLSAGLGSITKLHIGCRARAAVQGLCAERERLYHISKPSTGMHIALGHCSLMRQA